MKLILIGTLGSTIWKAVNTGIQFLLLWIDSVIYWFASQCYQLFIKLAATRIFEDNFFANFANRIYVVLGVFMLFYLAYALLTAIVDPEKLSKGDKGVSKIASNLVISLVILGFLPTIFSYAYRLQNYVLASNLIGSLVLGTPMTGLDEDDENKDAMLQYGDVLSFTVLNTFLNPDNVNFTITQRANTNADYNWYDLKADILENGDYSAMPMMNEAVANKATLINATGGSGTEARIDYKPVISTAAGVFLVYVLLTFTIDLGIRVVKFAFLQLIAPIPVIMRVIPGKKGTFDKWLKQTLSVYFEVFVRVAIMYLAIYFINAIANSASLDQFFGSESGIQGKLAFAIIIMGILAFAKQAPKMISDLLGIDTGGLKLGIGDKLKAGGFFAAGSAVGAAVTSHFNPFAIARGWNKGWKDGNFRAIGEEAQLRNKVLKARAEGSTWVGRRINDVRGFFGFDTTADVMDREIERTPYSGVHVENEYGDKGQIVGQRNIDMTRAGKAYLDRRKQTLSNMNAETDEKIRIQKASVEHEESVLKAATNVMDAAKDSVNKVDSSTKGNLSDKGYGTMTGNLSEMRKFVNQLSENMAPDTAALKAQYTSPSGVFNQAAYEQDYKARLQKHSQIISEYEKEINEIEKELTKQHITDVKAGTATDNKVSNLISTLETINGSAIATGDDIKNLKDRTQNVVNASNVEVTKLEQSKVNIAHEIAELDRIEAVHKSDMETLKQSEQYRSRNADKSVRGGGK